MKDTNPSPQASFDFKTLLSGGIYAMTLVLVITFIFTSLSGFLEGL